MIDIMYSMTCCIIYKKLHSFTNKEIRRCYVFLSHNYKVDKIQYFQYKKTINPV